MKFWLLSSLILFLFQTISYANSSSGRELNFNLDEDGYEICGCDNEEFTNRITKAPISSEVCINCDAQEVKYKDIANKDLVNLLGDIDPNLNIDSACIKASTQETIKPKAGSGLYRMCNASKTQLFQKDTYKACGKNLYVRRVCINKPYVDVTTEALNTISNCLKIAPKNLFPLLNHESRFLINNVSPTGALCYGQLTAKTVSYLNNLNKRNYKRYAKNNRYALSKKSVESVKLDNILNKCPKVASRFSRLKTKIKINSKGDEYTGYDGYESSCNVVESPYTCMLYSALNYKYNLDTALSYFNKATVYVSTNKKDNNQLIHKDKNTMEEYETRTKDMKAVNYLEYKEVKIFNDPKEAAVIAAYFAHNGGSGGTLRVLLKDYLEDFQSKLDNRLNVKLRRKFFSNELGTKYFYKEFKEYISKNYEWGKDAKGIKRRKAEVSNFVGKIISDLKVVSKKAGNSLHSCSNINSLVYDEAGGGL